MQTELNDNKRSQVDQILSNLRREIIEGVLKPKEKIFEEDLAKRFNISRSPIREAFRILESEGLIIIVPRRGAYVSDIDEEDIERINDIRIVLEGLCVRLACRNITGEGLEQLSTIAAKMTAAGEKNNYQEYFKLNKKFHTTIYEFTQNNYLNKMLSTLSELSHRYRFYVSYFTLKSQIRQLDKWHSELIEMLRKKDEKQAEKIRCRQVKKSSSILKKSISLKLKGRKE